MFKISAVFNISHQFNSISNHTETSTPKETILIMQKLPNDNIKVAWNSHVLAKPISLIIPYRCICFLLNLEFGKVLERKMTMSWCLQNKHRIEYFRRTYTHNMLWHYCGWISFYWQAHVLILNIALRTLSTLHNIWCNNNHRWEK